MIPQIDSILYVSVDNFRQIQQTENSVVMDVRISDAFEEIHIAGAVNHCIYEIVFLEEVGKTVADKGSAIVVYGESAAFKAAEVAYGRLKEAGYTNVTVLSGGLQAWIEAGGAVDQGADVKPGLDLSGRYEISRGKSTMRWIGRNLTNQHEGKIAIKSGWLAVNQSLCPVGGELILDMTKITCDDIADPSMNKVLIGHLSNDDFFKVDVFPEAGFTITEATAISDATPGSPNFEVSGDLTLRGVTRTATFPAMVNPVTGGIAFQAQFNVNRVEHGAIYGSGSLFERLGMHLVNDLVNIQITALFS